MSEQGEYHSIPIPEGLVVDLACYIVAHAEGRDPIDLGCEIAETQLHLFSTEMDELLTAICAARRFGFDTELAAVVERNVINSEIFPQVQAVIDKPYDVIVRDRHIQLEVVLPEKYVRRFIKAFNETLVAEMEEWYEGTKHLSVSICREHPGRVLVGVNGRYEGKLYKFIEDFCAKRRPPLSFRKPGERHGREAWCL